MRPTANNLWLDQLQIRKLQIGDEVFESPAQSDLGLSRDVYFVVNQRYPHASLGIGTGALNNLELTSGCEHGYINLAGPLTRQC